MWIDFVNSSGSKVTHRVLVHLITSDFSFLPAVGRQTTGQRRHSLIFTTVFFRWMPHVCDLHGSTFTYRKQFFF